MWEQEATTLKKVFSEVLADLAFMFTDQEECRRPSAGPVLETTITYHGPCSGSLQLRCPRDFSTRLAANLLGTDPQHADVAEAAADAVREFMNIVCGQFITAAHGSEDVFNLSIPRIVELTDPGLPVTGADPGSCVLAVEGEPVQLFHRVLASPESAGRRV